MKTKRLCLYDTEQKKLYSVLYRHSLTQEKHTTVTKAPIRHHSVVAG